MRYELRPVNLLKGEQKEQAFKQVNPAGFVPALAIDGQGCFALLGPNGAGKTTTLSMITGDLRPAGGEAYVDGLSVRTQIMEVSRATALPPAAALGGRV